MFTDIKRLDHQQNTDIRKNKFHILSVKLKTIKRTNYNTYEG